MNTHTNIYPVDIRWGLGSDAIPAPMRSGLEEGFRSLIQADEKLRAVQKVHVHRSRSKPSTDEELPDERLIVLFFTASDEMCTPAGGFVYLVREDDVWGIRIVPLPKKRSPTKSRRG